MAKMRVRWQSAARIGGAGLLAAAGLIAGPSLFRAPDPPPLPTDIGLPRGGSQTAAAQGAREKAERSNTRRDHRGFPRRPRSAPRRPCHTRQRCRHSSADPRAPSSRSGSRSAGGKNRVSRLPHVKGGAPDQGSAPAAPPPPIAAPAPPPVSAPPAPALSPPPAPAPAPAAPPPGDGSEEFAPH